VRRPFPEYGTTTCHKYFSLSQTRSTHKVKLYYNMKADKRSVTPLEPRECDVLCGQDNNLGQTLGNRLFRKTLYKYLPQYCEIHAPRERSKIITDIITTMKTRYGSRFIAKKWNRIAGKYYWEELNECQKRNKISHA
jgi:hypothetical protein